MNFFLKLEMHIKRVFLSLSVCLSVAKAGGHPEEVSLNTTLLFMLQLTSLSHQWAITQTADVHWILFHPPAWSTLKTCRTSWDTYWSDVAAGGPPPPLHFFKNHHCLSRMRRHVFYFQTHCWPVIWDWMLCPAMKPCVIFRGVRKKYSAANKLCEAKCCRRVNLSCNPSVRRACDRVVP